MSEPPANTAPLAVVVPLPVPGAAPRAAADLRRELDRLDQELSEAVRELAQIDRRRLIAEQLAHADLAEADEQIRQLEDEVSYLRWRLTRRIPDRVRTAVTSAELAAIRRGVVAAPSTCPAPPAPPPGLLDAERQMVEQRTRHQPSLLAPLRHLRAQLHDLRTEIEREGARRADAERRVTQAYEAIGVVRERLGHPFELDPVPAAAEPDPDPEPEPEPAPAEPLDAERFELALARLREAAPPPLALTPRTPLEPEAEPRTWFGRLLRRLRNGAQSG